MIVCFCSVCCYVDCFFANETDNTTCENAEELSALIHQRWNDVNIYDMCLLRTSRKIWTLENQSMSVSVCVGEWSRHQCTLTRRLRQPSRNDRYSAFDLWVACGAGCGRAGRGRDTTTTWSQSTNRHRQAKQHKQISRAGFKGRFKCRLKKTSRECTVRADISHHRSI